MGLAAAGRLRLRIAQRPKRRSGLTNEPPRSTRSGVPDGLSRPSVGWNGYGRYALDIHSQTLPAMSSRPYGLAPSGWAPTGEVVAVLRPGADRARGDASSSSPHG